jgi:hypothetical protein
MTEHYAGPGFYALAVRTAARKRRHHAPNVLLRFVAINCSC